ncbi:MAG: cobalt ECF transporter T component CbiQ, partial [Chloroflexota bacterium]
MKHSFIDRYSDRNSFIHRLDPRVKFLTSLAFIITVMLTPPTGWAAFALYLAIILTLVTASRVPLPYVLGRSLVIFPFVVMVVLFVPFLGQGQVAGSF